MEDQLGNDAGNPRSWPRRILFTLMGAGAVAALFATRPIAAAVQGASFHRFGGGHWGHHGFNPETAKAHVAIGVKWALRDVGATEDQRERVEKIAISAIDDIAALKERHQANREAFASRMAAATVDRAGLEEARKAELALADEASHRLVQALADAAEVLTPEQRQALLDHAHRFRH